MPLPVAVRHGGVDRDFSLDLIRIEIRRRAAVVDAAEPRDGAGGEQQRFDEGGLANAAVADDPEVADLSDLDRHKTGLLERAVLVEGECYHIVATVQKPRALSKAAADGS